MSEKDFKTEYIFTRNYQELKDVVDFLVSIGENIYDLTLRRSKEPLDVDNNYYNAIRFSFNSDVWSGYSANKTDRVITLDEFKAKYFPDLIQDNTSKEVVDELPQELPLVGEICYVRSTDDHEWEERIFLHDLGPRFLYRYVVVSGVSITEYTNGESNIKQTSYSQLLTKREYEEHLKNIPVEVSIHEAEQMVKDLDKLVKIYYLIICLL